MFYLFKTNSDTWKPYQAAIARSLESDDFVLVGPVFKVDDQHGRLEFFRKDNIIGQSSKVVTKNVYEENVEKSPISVQIRNVILSPNKCVVYRTVSGSEYVFVPVDAKIQTVQ